VYLLRLELFPLEYHLHPVACRLALNGRIPTFDVCVRLLPAAKSIGQREGTNGGKQQLTVSLPIVRYRLSLWAARDDAVLELSRNRSIAPADNAFSILI
jgi:hypothetical protein